MHADRRQRRPHTIAEGEVIDQSRFRALCTATKGVVSRGSSCAADGDCGFSSGSAEVWSAGSGTSAQRRGSCAGGRALEAFAAAAASEDLQRLARALAEEHDLLRAQIDEVAGALFLRLPPPTSPSAGRLPSSSGRQRSSPRSDSDSALGGSSTPQGGVTPPLAPSTPRVHCSAERRASGAAACSGSECQTTTAQNLTAFSLDEHLEHMMDHSEDGQGHPVPQFNSTCSLYPNAGPPEPHLPFSCVMPPVAQPPQLPGMFPRQSDTNHLESLDSLEGMMAERLFVSNGLKGSSDRDSFGPTKNVMGGPVLGGTSCDAVPTGNARSAATSSSSALMHTTPVPGEFYDLWPRSAATARGRRSHAMGEPSAPAKKLALMAPTGSAAADPEFRRVKSDSSSLSKGQPSRDRRRREGAEGDSTTMTPPASSFTLDSVGDMDSGRAHTPRSLHKSRSVNPIHMEDLRAETDTRLVARQTSAFNTGQDVPDIVGINPAPSASAGASLPTVLRIFLIAFGVVPVRAGRVPIIYRFFVLLLVGVAAAYYACRCVLETHYIAHASMAFFACGALISAMCLYLSRFQDLLSPEGSPLENFAARSGFLGLWRRHSLLETCLMLSLWAATLTTRFVACAVLPHLWPQGGVEAWAVPASSFVISTGMTTALMCWQLHLCWGLRLSVDMYCHTFFKSQDLGTGLNDWNMLQAMLRDVARTVEASFLALSTSNVVVVLLIGMEVYQHGQLTGGAYITDIALRLGWAFFVVVQAMRVVFSAAGVTEKCSRVPSLVNSWSFHGEDVVFLDPGRQYVVQYIEQSAAGFYVKGVRVRAYTALKISYLFGALLLTMVSSSVGWGDQ